MALSPLRAEMARTLLDGSGGQQHHNVYAAVLQPSGDPNGLRRHAIPVKKSFATPDFPRLLLDVHVFAFICNCFQHFSLIRRQNDSLFCFFLLVVAYSMIPTFARGHRTSFLGKGKGKERLGLAGWGFGAGKIFSMVRTI